MSARSRLILAVAAVATLVPATAAQAKGLAEATVCGAGGCTSATQRAQGPRDCRGCGAEQLLTALPGSAHPTRRAPYLRIVLGFGEPGGEVQGTERMLFAPALGLAARNGRSSDDWAWFELGPQALAVARRIALGVRPYPAAGMPLGAKALAATYEPAPRQAPDGASDVAILPGAAILAATFGLAALAALAVRRRRRVA